MCLYCKRLNTELVPHPIFEGGLCESKCSIKYKKNVFIIGDDQKQVRIKENSTFVLFFYSNIPQSQIFTAYNDNLVFGIYIYYIHNIQQYTYILYTP